MSYTALQNVPIEVNLVEQANYTGWTIDGDEAVHESCQSGSIQLTGFTITAGQTYEISYGVVSISGGFVQMHLGNTTGASRTTAGNYTETLTATGTSPILYFYSDANCRIKAFNIRNTVEDTSPTQRYTMVYSPVLNKWTSYYTMSPDYGFSMFIRTVLFTNGIAYTQLNGSLDRNNLFGTVYDSIVRFVENQNTAIVKSYLATSIQANQLLVTGDDGIETSLGQLSALVDTDFLQQSLSSGGLQVDLYDRYGVYMASFVNDGDGDTLKGNYMIMQLQSTDSENPMRLYTVNIKAAVQRVGGR